MNKQKRQLEYEIVDRRDYIWKTPKKIETPKTETFVCPHCSSALTSGYTLIPLDGNKRAKIPGLECGKCDILFSTGSKSLRQLLQDNSSAKEISLNGEKLWNYSYLCRKKAEKNKQFNKMQLKLNKLSEVKGGIMLVTLRCDDEQMDCVITRSKEPQINHSALITHYSSLLAREIISAIYHSPRKINLNGKKYVVETTYRQNFPLEIMPKDVKIKSGGGYFYSIGNKNDEVIDVLLFSVCTQRYELARATYNHADRKCFMDISLFRSFIREYGKPDIHLLFDNATSSGLSFYELRAESILHAYGYSVSDADGLTEAERHELLAEIVDLELLSIPYIVHLLEFFIRTHTSDRFFNARSKWERDVQFISNYKIDTKRFLIVR